MPDRHGPMRVVYQQRGGDEELPPTTWDTFENDTPEDVLDRITRGILQTDPQWLADALTPTEVTAVETAFGVTIGDSGGGGGDIERPADRFGIERFDGSADVTSDGITNLYYMIRVSDADDDGDVTGFRLEATAADDTTDSFEYLPEGPDRVRRLRSVSPLVADGVGHSSPDRVLFGGVQSGETPVVGETAPSKRVLLMIEPVQ